MSDVCVVTGGGSGMGLSAALQMPKDKIIIVSGRTISKLEKAVEQLKEGGHEAYACTCDTSDRESVKKLVEFAASKGTVRNVINAAGMSPNMLEYAAEKRMGTPDELGFAIATVADERNGYLAGVDVLVDGGSTNGKSFRKLVCVGT